MRHFLQSLIKITTIECNHCNASEIEFATNILRLVLRYSGLGLSHIFAFFEINYLDVSNVTCIEGSLH